MSSLIIIVIEVIFIIYNLNKQYKEIIKLNNKILEQKSEIIKINSICDTLNLLKIYNDINNINLNIDEYISNYSYLHNFNKDKTLLLNELKQYLIEKKNTELMNIMNTRLKTFYEIIPEIVKYELDELNKDLDEYKKILEIKINSINQHSIIININ